MSYKDFLTDDIIENIINIRTNENEIEISIHIIEMQMQKLILEHKLDKLEMDSDGNNCYWCSYNDNVIFHSNINPKELFKPFYIGKAQFVNYC